MVPSPCPSSIPLREFDAGFPAQERWDDFHLTAGEVASLLSSVDLNAVLYADTYWSLARGQNETEDLFYCPDLSVDLFNDTAVSVPVYFTKEAVTVGAFLSYLSSVRNADGGSLVVDDTLLFLNKEGSVEAVNGVRLNRDGSAALCTQDPSYLPS